MSDSNGDVSKVEVEVEVEVEVAKHRAALEGQLNTENYSTLKWSQIENIIQPFSPALKFSIYRQYNHYKNIKYASVLKYLELQRFIKRQSPVIQEFAHNSIVKKENPPHWILEQAEGLADFATLSPEEQENFRRENEAGEEILTEDYEWNVAQVLAQMRAQRLIETLPEKLKEFVHIQEWYKKLGQRWALEILPDLIKISTMTSNQKERISFWCINDVDLYSAPEQVKAEEEIATLSEEQKSFAHDLISEGMLPSEVLAEVRANEEIATLSEEDQQDTEKYMNKVKYRLCRARDALAELPILREIINLSPKPQEDIWKLAVILLELNEALKSLPVLEEIIKLEEGLQSRIWILINEHVSPLDALIQVLAEESVKQTTTQ